MSDPSDTRTDPTSPGRWDEDAIRAGASVCIALAVPFRVLAAVVGDEGSALDALLFVVFLLFFVVGSGCAAWLQQRGTPLSHALVTAAGSYLAMEAVFLVVRLVRGTQIPWFGILFTLMLVLTCAILGGLFGSRLQSQGYTPSRRRR